MRLLDHRPTSTYPNSCFTIWHVSGVLIEAHWEAPLTLNSVQIMSYGSVLNCNNGLLPSLPAQALLKERVSDYICWLVCEVLCARLELDDPLLLEIMPVRISSRCRLLDSVKIWDRRQFEDPLQPA